MTLHLKGIYVRSRMNSFCWLTNIQHCSLVSTNKIFSRTHILNNLAIWGSSEEFDMTNLSAQPRATQKCNKNDEIWWAVSSIVHNGSSIDELTPDMHDLFSRMVYYMRWP